MLSPCRFEYEITGKIQRSSSIYYRSNINSNVITMKFKTMLIKHDNHK